MTEATRITVTGAAGQIGYALLFRIAAGGMLGPQRPVILQLLEIPAALDMLRGLCMELEDCAFPLLRGVSVSSDANEAFGDTQYAMLVGARPRSKGMERKDLLQANAAIFAAQGRALNDSAHPEVRVLVVGNPANTNALIAQHNAPRLAPQQFSAMTRLDHNRTLGQLAGKLGCPVGDFKRIAIWGNHSATQYPDLYHASCAGSPLMARLDEQWYHDTLIPTVQQRGAAVIAARQASSAASAACAAIDHMRDWALGTPAGDWSSMAVPSNGAYQIPEGLFYSYPTQCDGGKYQIVEGLEINDFSREKMQLSARELEEERQAVQQLLP